MLLIEDTIENKHEEKKTLRKIDKAIISSRDNLSFNHKAKAKCYYKDLT